MCCRITHRRTGTNPIGRLEGPKCLSSTAALHSAKSNFTAKNGNPRTPRDDQRALFNTQHKHTRDVHSHNIDAQVGCCGQNAALCFQEGWNVRVATRRRRRYARVLCAFTHTRLHAKRLCAAVIVPVSRRSTSVPRIWKFRFSWFRCANLHSCKLTQMVCPARLRGSRHPRDGGRWFEKLFLARKKKRASSAYITCLGGT
jgi:hypothetical protein